MKKLNIVLVSFLAILLACCNSDDAHLNSGYLTINIMTASSTHDKGSRTIPADYNAKQLAIEIVDNTGAIVNQTDDASMWEGENIPLKPGTYTVNVHSNNWDGNDSGRNVPFYAGAKEVTISVGEKSEANIICILANVKVSVDFDNSVASKFKSAYVTVESAVDGILPQTFTMGDEASLVSAYFPAGNLTATLHVTNKAGTEYTKVTELTDVNARDHYKLHYTVEASGEGSFTVTANDTETTYSYNLYVPGDPNVTFNTSLSYNEWATFAMLEGSITDTSIDDIDDTKVVFQIKPNDAEEWNNIIATKDGSKYNATATDLTAAKKYDFRLAYVDGANVYNGTSSTFTTEAAPQLPNSGFEDWCVSGRLNYACTSEEVGNYFWGSSNVNVTITQINGVSGSSDCHSGSKAASLQSKYVSVIGIKKFAAGSIFSGNMPKVAGTNGASIDFGRDFTARPSQLTGYFKYSTDVVNQMGSYALPEGSNVVKGETSDLWSAYIVLMTEKYTLDNSTEAKLKASLRDFKGGTDPAIIAYGELPDEKCVAASDWTKFTVDLHYFDLTTRPTYIVVVFSSSKYGDYFTGSDKSLLLIDDLELSYGIPSF